MEANIKWKIVVTKSGQNKEMANEYWPNEGDDYKDNIGNTSFFTEGNESRLLIKKQVIIRIAMVRAVHTDRTR